MPTRESTSATTARPRHAGSVRTNATVSTGPPSDWRQPRDRPVVVLRLHVRDSRVDDCARPMNTDLADLLDALESFIVNAAASAHRRGFGLVDAEDLRQEARLAVAENSANYWSYCFEFDEPDRSKLIQASLNRKLSRVIGDEVRSRYPDF